MITLQEIAGRLESKPEDNRKTAWNPETVDDYTLPEFNIYESTAKGAKTLLKKKLSKVLAFVNSVRSMRAEEGCTIMPISVTSRANQMIWTNKKGVSNAIAYMKEIGLISTENDYYRFNAYVDCENTCKLYRYYKENEDKLRAYCERNNIEPYWTENVVYSLEEVLNRDRSIDGSKVRFKSKLKLMKPSYMSNVEFEKQLTLCLYENYPGLRFHIMKANEINSLYYKDYPEFRVRFQPKFEWSVDGSYVKRIGVRATNSITNTKKADRVNILNNHGLTLEKDINASVPRMTLSLNSSHWMDESVDLYELIYRVIEPSGEFTHEMREAIKKLHMRVYFDSSSAAATHHIWRLMDKNGVLKQDVNDTIEAFREAIIEAEGGKLYGSDIFYVESCVYLMTLYDLLSSGHMVWQVYDCFYSTGKEDKEQFEEMISNGVRFNFDEFVRKYWRECVSIVVSSGE